MTFIIIFLSAGEARAAEKKQEIVYLPILMYHQISTSKSRLSEYVISPEEFENDLKLLQQHGYTTITVADLVKYVNNKGRLPQKPVMITFDDGFESDYAYAFPLLKQYKMKAVFSILGKYTDMFSEKDVHKNLRYSHISWDQIKEMHESGLAEFNNHTYNMHDNRVRRGALKRSNESEAEYRKVMVKDLGTLNAEFEKYINYNPPAFACPFGHYNDTLCQILKDFGFSAVLTSYQKLNKLTGNPEELYHLNRYVRPHNMDLEKLIKSWEATIEKEVGQSPTQLFP